MIQPERPYMKIQAAHALCKLDNKRYRHTLTICNPYRISTAKMATRTRLNITLYERCLYWHVLSPQNLICVPPLIHWTFTIITKSEKVYARALCCYFTFYKTLKIYIYRRSMTIHSFRAISIYKWCIQLTGFCVPAMLLLFVWNKKRDARRNPTGLTFIPCSIKLNQMAET